ncbi:hypothetical protein Poly30_34360 [Planctomycetes bacterium Poly30]|uniref:Lipoprotein n=1 Tax=Saltatorellus ferox TaxID=2528018 RepID=A0A518EV08_9BACT|nr:hypothetical protein Poly30_34360 [Planctomycetes bacterium Poly30]
MDRRHILRRFALPPFALLSLCALLALASCSGTRKVTDPVLNIRTSGGEELGVSTEYGVVFLGKRAERGEVEVEAWFGDGPSIERSVIEPVGGGLFTAEMDIELPQVPISFTEPRDGETLEIMGRKGGKRWTTLARVRTDPRVLGLLLEISGGFPDDPDQVGAGVYRKTGKFERELVGLVTGKIQLERKGSIRKYLAVAGPSVMWRFAAHRRDLLRRKPFVYREDIL